MGVKETAAGGLRLVGGRLCLDFVNTVGGRSHAQGGRRAGSVGEILCEKLNSYDDLVSWGAHAGAITSAEARRLHSAAEGSPAEAKRVLERALELRVALYGLFRAVVLKQRVSPSDMEVFSNEAAALRGRERLVHRSGRFEWAPSDASGSIQSVLWPVVTSATDLLTSGDLERLKQCGGDACGWIFEDTSRNRSRQWCHMQGCGNVAKVRSFRARLRGVR